MHRTAAAARAAGRAAEHFCHQGFSWNASHQRVAVLAVGCEDGVCGCQRWHHADRNRFFAVIEMQEAADLAGRIQFGTAVLECPDAQIVVQTGPAFRIGGVGRSRFYFMVPQGTEEFRLNLVGVHTGPYGAVAAAFIYLDSRHTLQVFIPDRPGRTNRALDDGAYVVHISATDYAGRSAVSEIRFTVDGTVPSPSTQQGMWGGGMAGPGSGGMPGGGMGMR